MFCTEQAAGVKEVVTFSSSKAAADSSCRLPSVPDKRPLFTLLVISPAYGGTLHKKKDNQQVLV